MSTYPVVDLNQSKSSPAPEMTTTPANPANRNDPTNTATQSNDTGSPYPSYTLQEFEEEEAKIKSMPSWPPKIRAKFKNTHPYVEKIGSISRRITYGIKGAKTLARHIFAKVKVTLLSSLRYHFQAQFFMRFHLV